MQKINPCLWFDHNAEEAVNRYVSIFKNSKILGVSRYGKAGKEIHGRPAGSVMTVAFELDGQRFTALNGGPHFKFNEAVSFQVNCETQEEVDYYWEQLSQGGDKRRSSAAGSRTGSGYPGRSSRPRCQRCCKTRTARKRTASW